MAGVTSFDDESRERVRLVAEQIALRTGLDVDITLGSSPTPMNVSLHASALGVPAPSLHELWTNKGVALVIQEAIDARSVLLFGLIRAGRTTPAAAVRRGGGGATVRHVRLHGATSVGIASIVGRPRRVVLAALAVALPTASLISLLTLVREFRGQVVGTVLGDAVAVQVRGAHLAASGVRALMGLVAALWWRGRPAARLLTQD